MGDGDTNAPRGVLAVAACCTFVYVLVRVSVRERACVYFICHCGVVCVCVFGCAFWFYYACVLCLSQGSVSAHINEYLGMWGC